MKKKLLLIPILAVMFSFFMVGCAGGDKSETTYNKQTLIDATKNVVNTYGSLSEAEETYYLEAGTDLEKTAANGFKQAKESDKVGEFKNFNTSGDKVTIEPQSDGSILCAIIAEYSNRDVKITVKYVKDPSFFKTKQEMLDTIQEEAIQYGYQSLAEYFTDVNEMLGVNYNVNSADEWIAEYLASQGVGEYSATECEVSAVYSKGELLAKAGRNTAIGMGTVFVVLIFISFIISLLKFVPALVGGKKKEEPKKAAPVKAAPVAAPAAPAAKTENLMNDAELVAVITAAIYALESETKVNAVSKDTLVVRSIRRAR